MLLTVAIGVVGGVLSGLFGVGGGIVFVPGLVLFAHLGQLDAEATSLVAIVPVALVGTVAQDRRGHVRRRDALLIGGLSAAGTAGGVLLANWLPAAALRYAFAVLILAIAVQLVRHAPARSPRKGDPPAVDAP